MRKLAEDVVRLCVVLDKDTRVKLRLIAAHKDMSLSEVVRWILKEFLNELEKE